jgi:hypothetical protein
MLIVLILMMTFLASRRHMSGTIKGWRWVPVVYVGLMAFSIMLACSDATAGGSFFRIINTQALLVFVLANLIGWPQALLAGSFTYRSKKNPVTVPST